MSTKHTPEYWADWLVDAVAGATQDRRFLRGDPAEDKIATEAIYLNGKHALAAIATPPDLLAAFKAITDQLERIGDPRPGKDGPFIDDAREAIAKAEGRS